MKKSALILPYVLQKVHYVLFFVVYNFFMRFEVKGQGALEEKSGPFVFAMNHTHELDATVFPFVLPFWSHHFPLFFVAAAAEKYKTFGWRGYFYGGKFFNALGAYSVFSGHQNYAYALQSHEEILKKGYSVCIFPEGKRTLDGNLGPARGGLGYLAYATGAHVVPVAVSGFYRLTLKDFFLRRAKLTLTIGEPFLPHIESSSKEDFQKAGEEVMTKIKEML
ncbi:MAG: 1-acyl-sn-glycerol-3-phosphate acyltransferase, 1-acyl-sn-glycerol-3-phosphate acyltransferase [Candidatus Parcubacteria bacterium]